MKMKTTNNISIYLPDHKINYLVGDNVNTIADIVNKIEYDEEVGKVIISFVGKGNALSFYNVSFSINNIDNFDKDCDTTRSGISDRMK